MIGAALDLLLIALLIGALVYGVRLEKKLRYLRETQAGFAGAAAELNMAIARAERGLQEIRDMAGEAQVVLGDRLQDARAASARLDQRLKAADVAADRLERITAARESPRPPRAAAPEPRPQPAAEPADRFGPLHRLRRPAEARAHPDDELTLDTPLPLRPAALSRRPGAEPQAAERPRAGRDDELFEPRKAGLRR